MSKRRFSEFVAVVLAMGFVCAAAGPSTAQEGFIQTFRRIYELGPQSGKCNICHTKKEKEEEGRNNLNLYGKSIQGAAGFKPLLDKKGDYKFTKEELETFTKVVTGLDDMDADGDKFTNKEELATDSFPGDPKSVPDAKKLADWKKAQAAAKTKKKK